LDTKPQFTKGGRGLNDKRRNENWGVRWSDKVFFKRAGPDEGGKEVTKKMSVF